MLPSSTLPCWCFVATWGMIWGLFLELLRYHSNNIVWLGTDAPKMHSCVCPTSLLEVPYPFMHLCARLNIKLLSCNNTTTTTNTHDCPKLYLHLYNIRAIYKHGLDRHIRNMFIYVSLLPVHTRTARYLLDPSDSFARCLPDPSDLVSGCLSNSSDLSSSSGSSDSARLVPIRRGRYVNRYSHVSCNNYMFMYF